MSWFETMHLNVSIRVTPADSTGTKLEQAAFEIFKKSASLPEFPSTQVKDNITRSVFSFFEGIPIKIS